MNEIFKMDSKVIIEFEDCESGTTIKEKLMNKNKLFIYLS
jgi:hypothetical protein